MLDDRPEVVDGTNYQFNRTYSATTGLLETLRYPVSTSGFRLKIAYEYQNGLLKRVRHDNGSVTWWEAVSTNAWGALQNETFGNGVGSYTQYDPANGWLFKREAGVGGGTGLIDARVAWNLNGNFAKRENLKQGLTEEFSYDAINRLTGSTLNGTPNLTVTLDAIGNVTSRSDVGSYTYHATKRRAVVTAGSNTYGYDANGNMTSRNGSAIAYASYNLPTAIASGANSSAFAYGAWRNRAKQIAVTGGVTETTIYVAGLLEQVTKGGATELSPVQIRPSRRTGDLPRNNLPSAAPRVHRFPFGTRRGRLAPETGKLDVTWDCLNAYGIRAART